MITIDTESSVSLEDQLRDEIRHAVARGEIVPGDVLPSARQLAGDLGIHWNTVARAYRRLCDEGLLAVGRGRRAVVRMSALPGAPAGAAARGRVLGLLREAITEARLGGLDPGALPEMLLAELASWDSL